MRSKVWENIHLDINVVTRARGTAESAQIERRGDRHLHHRLPANGANLDLDVDNAERFSADIDLDEAWIDRLVELTESRNQTHGA